MSKNFIHNNIYVADYTEDTVPTRADLSVRYRLYTEDLDDRDTLHDLVDLQFEGYTLYSGVGSWKGARENSTVVEICGTPQDRVAVYTLAARIKAVFRQESVLVTEESIFGVLV